MSALDIAWLNQWLPIAKWLAISSLLFLFPCLLEAWNRWCFKPIAFSAAQLHHAWGLALIASTLTPILFVFHVTWSIPIRIEPPATGTTQSVFESSPQQHSVPIQTIERISSQFELNNEDQAVTITANASSVSSPVQQYVETIPPSRSNAIPLSFVSPWQYVWLAIYASGTSLFLFRLVRAHVIAITLVKLAIPINELDRITPLLQKCSIPSSVRLGWSECTTIPILVGQHRPMILLPYEAHAWPTSKLESVLLHEHAHIQRADLLWLRIANLICALYWIQPFVWIAAHRMRNLREEACDDLVINFGKDGKEYSEHLIQIAERASMPVFSVEGLGMAHSNSLGKRILRILDLKRNRATSGWGYQSIVFVSLVSLFSLVLLALPSRAVGTWKPVATELHGENLDDRSVPAADHEQSSNAETISGMVVDSKGNPVAGCMVWGRGWNESMKAEFKQTRTDDQGSFLLTLPKTRSDWHRSVHINAFHENRVASLPLLMSRSSSGIQLELEPCMTIPLKVENESGEPVSGAKICFVDSDSQRNFYAVEQDFQFIHNRTVESDEDGLLDVLVPYWCVAPRVTVMHPEYCQDEVKVQQNRKTKIVMQRGSSIDIQLRTSIPGIQLEDSFLQVLGNNQYLSPSVDSKGHAQVRVKGLPVCLEVTHPRIGLKPGQTLVARQNVVRSNEEIVLEISPLITISGKLVDEDSGLAAVGCRVQLQDLSDSRIGSNWGSSATNELGEFKIECSSRTQARLMLGTIDPYILPESSEILVDRPGENDVVLPDIVVRPRPKAKIRVVDNIGEPVEGALIAHGSPNEQFATTDKDGRAALTPRSKFELLRILHPTKELCYLDSWSPMTEAEETIVLQPEIQITGKVVDLKGLPIVGCPVFIDCSAISEKNNTINSSYHSDVTDEKGEYRLRGMSKNVRNFMSVTPELLQLRLLEPMRSSKRSSNLETITVDRKQRESIQSELGQSEKDGFDCQTWWNGQTSLKDQIDRIVIVREFSILSERFDKSLIELQRIHQEYQGKKVTCIATINAQISREEIEQTIQRLGLTFSIGQLTPRRTSAMQKESVPWTKILRPTANKIDNCPAPLVTDPLPIAIRNVILHSDKP